MKLNCSLLLTPDRVVLPTGWIGHIPFAFWLIEILKPDLFVELGVHSGNSYFAFCQSVLINKLTTKCYGVDHWCGDEHAGFYEEKIFDEVYSYNKYKYHSFSQLMRMSFDEALSFFAEKSIDLLHIDGLHTYDAAKHDFISWLPKLSERAIVLFHDINAKERDFGVWKFWNEISKQYPSVSFNHSYGLGVLGVGKELNNEMFSFFEEFKDISNSYFIQLLFSKLGMYVNFDLTDSSDILKTEVEQENKALSDMLIHELCLKKDKIIQLEDEIKLNQKALHDNESVFLSLIKDIKIKDSLIFELEENLKLYHQVLLERNSAIDDLDAVRKDLHKQNIRILELEMNLSRVLNSSSWKMTKPIRKLVKSVRKRARKIRNFFFVKPTICDGSILKASMNISQPIEVARDLSIDGSIAIPFDFLSKTCTFQGRCACVIHLYYEELSVEIYSYLSNIPFDVDLYISTTDKDKARIIGEVFSDWQKGSVDIKIVLNRGRDIASKIVGFRDVYSKYEYVLFIHGKKSTHADVLALWRSFFLESLVGTSDVVKSIFEIFQFRKDIGIVSIQHFEPMRHWLNWGSNFKSAYQFAQQMGFELKENDPLDFPAGSMFWARTSALQPLLELNLSMDDFDVETGQKDGTVAHAIERLFYYSCEISGFNWIKVARPEFYSTTPKITHVSNPADLDSVIDDLKFKLLMPGNVQPRKDMPTPISRPSEQLFSIVRQHSLGHHISISPSLKVAIGLVTYNNTLDEINRSITAAKVSLQRAGFSVIKSLYIIHNGTSAYDSINENSFIELIHNDKNHGFGVAHNILMSNAFNNGFNIYITLNPDGILHPDAITALVKTIQASYHKVLVEAIQFPVEHPKPYDTEHLDTPWVSGACLAIPKEIYEHIGGFDDQFFMYCEDVDYSWRARAHGYALKTCPSALFLHAVTNRDITVTTKKLIYDSGLLLARKWRNSVFEEWLIKQFHSQNMTVPEVRPELVPEEWRKVSDFSHYFSFAQPRW